MPGIEHVDFDPPHLRFLVEPAALAEALSPEQDRPSLQGRLKKLSEKAQAEAGDNKQAVSEDERDDMWRR